MRDCDDCFAHSVRKTVRSFSKEVRVVFYTGRSLKDMLVSSSYGDRECPKVAYNKKARRGRGRPQECRACDAGIIGISGQCLTKNVVYSMFCSLCKAEYVGKTERSVRERFQEHYRQARARTPGTPWGEHNASNHRDTAGATAPFRQASMLAKEASRVNRTILEATFFRERRLIINDCG